jgi:hypothetical protein
MRRLQFGRSRAVWLLRCVRAAAATTLALLLSGSPAVAADRPTAQLAMQADSANLRVHYTSDPGSPHRVDDSQVQRLLANGEAAYTTITAAWDYQILRDGLLGGDERIDIYVAGLPAGKSGRAQPDRLLAQSSGFVTIAPARVTEPRTIAHELFHLAQYALDRAEATWLKEGSAEWAEHRITGDYAHGLAAFRPEIPLDCALTACGDGYAAWRFFEYLSERYGDGIVKRIFEHARDLGPGVQALTATQRALAERGTTLAAAFGGFAAANMAGAYARPEVAAWRSPPSLSVGAPAVGRSGSATVVVGRFATRYLAIVAAQATSCRIAALRLRVVAPPGRATRPSYRSGVAGPALPLPGAGAALDWNTCAGLAVVLAIPNTSVPTGPASYRVEMSTSAASLGRPRPPASPPVPGRTSAVRLVPDQRMASVMRRGLRLRLAAARPGRARVTVTALTDRRQRRTHRLRRVVTRTLRIAQRRTVALRLRRARTRARPPRRLRLDVRVRVTDDRGETRTRRMTVTVTARTARSSS